MNRNLIIWEIAGACVIIACGSLLHFVFEWLGNYYPVALIAAVNESVWEHLKLAFWPSLIWAGIEYPYLRKLVPNFLVAKITGIIVMPIFIVIVFYSYTSVVGSSILFVDISTFVIAVFAGQIVSYKILLIGSPVIWLKNLSLVALALSIFAFSLFTYFPPRLPLFEDSRNGSYGITTEIK